MATVEDPAQGSDAHQLHRDPVAVLAGLLDERDQLAGRSAVALAADSADEMARVQTPAELLTDAAHLVATERTARWLDELVDEAALTPEQRARIAAEDGAPSLTRVLRRAELAGLDPRQVLHDAVGEHPPTEATNTTNGIYSRITDGNTRRFEPTGETYADWTPRTGSSEWDAFLAALAAAADQHAAEVGRVAAA